MSATASRDRATGRYAARPEYARCGECGWTLAESLAGGEFCANGKCAAHRKCVRIVPGVDAGSLAGIELGGAA